MSLDPTPASLLDGSAIPDLTARAAEAATLGDHGTFPSCWADGAE